MPFQHILVLEVLLTLIAEVDWSKNHIMKCTSWSQCRCWFAAGPYLWPTRASLWATCWQWMSDTCRHCYIYSLMEDLIGSYSIQRQTERCIQRHRLQANGNTAYSTTGYKPMERCIQRHSLQANRNAAYRGNGYKRDVIHLNCISCWKWVSRASPLPMSRVQSTGWSRTCSVLGRQDSTTPKLVSS